MNLMKCQKCGYEFPENQIHNSHDVPKYMGGTDKDGKHWLCEKCHDDYEREVMKVTFMNLVKELPEDLKEICRNSARIVKQYFFKRGKNGAK